MKKQILLLVLASMAMSGGVVYASTNDSGFVNANSTTHSNLVYVARDVTDQAMNSITYTKYGKNGQVTSKKIVKAPKGSLVEYVQVPMVQALANNEDFVVPTSNQSAFENNLESLHQKLFKTLNANTTIKPMNIACQTPSYTASGSFAAYNATINYAIDYNTTNATCQINPTKYSVWQSQGTGTAWLHKYSWYNFSTSYTSNYPQIPYYAANALQPTLGADWYGPYGQNFTTLVQGNDITGTYYSGYVALQ